MEMFSVNSVRIAFCKPLFCHDSLGNVAAFKAVLLPAAKQRIFKIIFDIYPFFVLPLNF